MSRSYSRIHRGVQRIIAEAISGVALDAPAQAALDQHLAECVACRRFAARMKKLEARLGGELPRRWPATPLTEVQRASILENIQSHTRSNPMQTRFSGTIRALALGTLAILLIIALGWGVRTLRPASSASGGETPTAITGQAPLVPTEEAHPASTSVTPSGSTSTPTLETISLPPPPTTTEQASLPPTPTPVPPPVLSGPVSLFPRVQFSFLTDFPSATGSVAVYRQVQPEAITADLARQAAAQLGVSGEVVAYTGEGGWPIYEVHGGGSVVRFLGAASQFMYEVRPYQGYASADLYPPFEQQAASAEVFLRQKGLLAGAYHVEPVPTDPGTVRFVQLLDELEVRYGVGVSRMGGTLQWIDVSLTPEGAVIAVAFNGHNYEHAGEFSILSAQQAWERFSAGPTGAYGMYAILAAEQPVTYRAWVRDYAPGQGVHVYGYAVGLPSAEGKAPLVQFSYYPLRGSTQGIETGQFLHTWGQFVLDDQGLKTFQIEGWERSPLVDSFFSGTVERQGDAASLHTTDGQVLAMPDLPPDVPAGEQVNVRGVILNGALEWSYIDAGETPGYYGYTQSCGGGGGGGSQTPQANFGGQSLAALQLGGIPSSPAQPALPYQAGDTLDGVTGNVWITLNQYADRTETAADMWVEGAEGMTFVAHLSGAGLGGIETYNALPVKVWGRVNRTTGSEMYFTVDRFEEAYPGLRLQAWIGSEEPVSLEGKDALLFTTLDGQQFVLKNSIGYGDLVRVGQPGDTVIREGLLLPGLTLGGYPVIQELGGQMANGMTDLTGYTITSSQPAVYDQTREAPLASPESQVEGQVDIEQIELVYLSRSLAGCPPEAASYTPDLLYVQPVWRFRGIFADGRRFELLLQALPDVNFSE